MSDLKDRVLEVIAGPSIMALATLTEDGKPWVRYVVPVADRDLNLRFSTFLGSRKVAQITRDPNVHLTGGGGTLEGIRPWVQVVGVAEVSSDPELKSAMWNEMLSAYFSGPDDPDYCVVTVRPTRIEYLGGDTSEPEVLEP